MRDDSWWRPNPATDTDWNKEKEMNEEPGVAINLDTLVYGRDLQIIAALRELLKLLHNDESIAAVLGYVADDFGLCVIPKGAPNESP